MGRRQAALPWLWLWLGLVFWLSGVNVGAQYVMLSRIATSTRARIPLALFPMPSALLSKVRLIPWRSPKSPSNQGSSLSDVTLSVNPPSGQLGSNHKILRVLVPDNFRLQATPPRRQLPAKATNTSVPAPAPVLQSPSPNAAPGSGSNVLVLASSEGSGGGSLSLNAEALVSGNRVIVLPDDGSQSALETAIKSPSQDCDMDDCILRTLGGGHIVQDEEVVLLTQRHTHVVSEMDMLLTVSQYQRLYGIPPLNTPFSSPGRQRRKAIRGTSNYWPNGIVYYKFDYNGLSREDVMLIESCMREWERATCVRFRLARGPRRDVVVIRDGRGCMSTVGKVGGPQRLILQLECRIRRVILHELGHTLGLVHEHMRPERDFFVDVLYENVEQGLDKNFRKYTESQLENFGTRYDYLSIMHYGKTAFSKDKYSVTMRTKDPLYQDLIGKVDMLSQNDVEVVNRMYRCTSLAEVLRYPVF